jgi:hypothetical protein
VQDRRACMMRGRDQQQQLPSRCESAWHAEPFGCGCGAAYQTASLLCVVAHQQVFSLQHNRAGALDSSTFRHC